MFNVCLMEFSYFRCNDMASIKIILYKSNKKSDGTYPVVIRVIQGRKAVYHQLGCYLKPSEWDEKMSVVKKSHPNSVRLNHSFLKKLTEVSAVFLDANNNDVQLTKKQIKHKIKHHNKSSFTALADDHLSDLLKLKKYNQHSGEKPKLNHFKNFLDDEDISFKDITTALLQKYMIYLEADKNLNKTSVMNCLIVIRTIFNKAMSLGLVESKYYPFGKGKIQIKTFETRKIGLNEIEVKQLEEAELKFAGHINARNIWMTSFY